MVLYEKQTLLWTGCFKIIFQNFAQTSGILDMVLSSTLFFLENNKVKC